MHQSRSAARLGAGIAVAFAAFALAGPVLAAPAHARHAAGSPVKVTATEFKFKLSLASVTAGSVTFTIVNKGKLAHDFAIAGKKSALIAPGKSGEADRDAQGREVPVQVHRSRTRRGGHEGDLHRQVAPARRGIPGISGIVNPPLSRLKERLDAATVAVAQP